MTHSIIDDPDAPRLHIRSDVVRKRVIGHVLLNNEILSDNDTLRSIVSHQIDQALLHYPGDLRCKDPLPHSGHWRREVTYHPQRDEHDRYCDGQGYRTRTGRILTDDDLHRLAAEAEKGHPDAGLPPTA